MKACPVCRNSYPADFTVCPRDASVLVDLGAWRDGAVVRGRYRILGKIGEGGMGTVYKAEHVHFQEMRALKVIRGDLANDQIFVSRFRQEAVISRKLQHSNAVKVEDIDEAEDGRPFIVMEFIEGSSLKEVIRTDAPLPVTRACGIVKQAAGALHAAHQLGIVHRDIKPANIVLLETPSGEQVKVLDFGIAKLKEGYLQDNRTQSTLTGTGMVVGTPAYISPEQAVGKRGQELDGRSDLYSLAIVAFQMLTGDLPFKADSDVGFALAHLQTLPPSLHERRPDIPPEIANVIMSCLEKNPELRPATAKTLVQKLEAAELIGARSGTAPSMMTKQVMVAKPVEPAPVPDPPKATTREQIMAHVFDLQETTTPAARTGSRWALREWALYVAAGIVVVALVAGVWYVTRSPVPAGQNPSVPMSAPATDATLSSGSPVEPVVRSPENKAEEEAAKSAPDASSAPVPRPASGGMRSGCTLRVVSRMGR